MARRELSFDSLELRPLLSGLTPAQLRQFYGFNHVYDQDPATKGAGITIAVVVAYDNPAAATDVARYFDGPYHLPALSLSTFNLGAPGNQPDLSWSGEAETDLEMVHSIAPLAHIDLVEAADDGLLELMAADQYAASLPGVVVVSDSWGVPEFATENQLDSYLSAPGVTFVAAAGDNGVPDYPAVSPATIAVGGTWVTGNTEFAWSGSGSGMSQVYPGRRAPDVSMAVNSTELTGTSVSAPLFAGLVGIADAVRVQQGLPPLGTAAVRSLMNSAVGTTQYHHDFNDIVRGPGAGPGPDAATGLGSPKAPGLVALLSGSSAEGSSTVKPLHRGHASTRK